jgi:putative peptidoglycan lipid II flippase
MVSTRSGEIINRAPRRQITRAAIVIAALTAIVRAGAVGKELIIAWRFGTGDDLDAFLISVVVPLAAISIIASSFSAALIPMYIHVKQHEGLEAAHILFQRIMGWAVLLLILITVLIVIAAPIYLPLFASGFSAEKLHLTLGMIFWNTPVIMFSGIAAMWSATLNAEGRFAIAAISPLTTPVLTVCLLWFAPSWRTFALVAGIVCGALAEMLLLGIALRHRGFSLRPRWPQADPNVRRVAAQFFPAMSGAILTSGNFMVDQAMAAMLPAGSVASLNYGNRVIQFPIALAATALGTALMPYFSRLAATKEWVELIRSAHHYLKWTLMFSVPLAILFFVFSEPLVGLLFRRGAFTAKDVHLVGRIQAFYALELPFYLAGIIVVRLISAVQANRLLLWAASINLVTNALLNYLFMRWMGVAGIALSTSLVYFSSFMFCYVAIMSRLPRGTAR